MDPKNDLKNLFIEGYNFSVWSKNEKESTDKKELTDKEESVDFLTTTTTRWWRKSKWMKWIKNFNSKQIIN